MKLIIRTIKDALKTPGFSLLYIIGVALTIAFTMIYCVLLYGQLAPVYPEYDRSSTFYVSGISIRKGVENTNAGFSQRFIDDYLKSYLKSANLIVSTRDYHSRATKVQTDGSVPEFKVGVKRVAPSFFDLYGYEFVAGKPFTQSDFDSKLKVALISDKVAARLFGSFEEAVGKYLKLNHVKHRIVGVFREGNALSVDSYAEVFTPYFSDGALSNYYSGWPNELAGSLNLVIKVKPGKKAQLAEELTDLCRRINAIDTAAPKVHIGMIESHLQHVLADHKYEIKDDDFQVQEGPGGLVLWRPLIVALFIVLVVPALNISGLISSRLERITPEIGIRRSFGATRRRLMIRVMTENLVLTLIGGIVGLILAWLILVFARDFLMQFTPLSYITDPIFGDTTSFVTAEMAFAPVIFMAVLVICLLLNMLSAWIPTRHALHKQITDSINTKR